MSSEAMRLCSYILLAAGILLFVLTVILSFKFEIVQMLISERAEKKKASGRAGQDESGDPANARTESTVTEGSEIRTESGIVSEVPMPVTNSEPPAGAPTTPIKSGPAQPVSAPATPIKSGSAQPVSAPTTPIRKQNNVQENKPLKKKGAVTSTTVVISGNKSVPDKEGTVVISKSGSRNALRDDYEIIENIIVIHGDPNIISL